MLHFLQLVFPTMGSQKSDELEDIDSKVTLIPLMLLLRCNDDTYDPSASSTATSGSGLQVTILLLLLVPVILQQPPGKSTVLT